MVSAGEVLTGGTSSLKGITAVGEEYLKMPVRIGYPENMGLEANGQHGPEYSAVLGNIIYAASSSGGSVGTDKQRMVGGLLSRINRWLTELFK